MATQSDPLTQHLEICQEVWKTEHERVKNELWPFENFLTQLSILFEGMVHNVYWAWWERVSRGKQRYTPEEEEEYRHKFVVWLAYFEMWLPEIQAFENTYGTVEGAGAVRRNAGEAQRIITSWESPSLPVKSHSDCGMSGEEMAEALEAVSTPSVQASVSLRHPIDCELVF